MNNITDLLDLEDSDIKISDIIIEGQTKTLIIETPPVASYCPICGFRMHSRGVKKRTINHPILQDGYSLILLLKQRRWRCSNPDCLYEVNESFRFVNKGRRTTNATDMLIVEAYRNLLETSASKHNVLLSLQHVLHTSMLFRHINHRHQETSFPYNKLQN